VGDDQMVELGRYEGKRIVGTGVIVKNAGDGLSKAMAVDPVRIGLRERGYLVIEWECVKHQHEPVKDAPTTIIRTHVLRAETATFIDDDMVVEAIEKQKIRLEEAEGIRRLEFGDGTGEVDEDSD
jgi:hypothetical protein